MRPTWRISADSLERLVTWHVSPGGWMRSGRAVTVGEGGAVKNVAAAQWARWV